MCTDWKIARFLHQNEPSLDHVDDLSATLELFHFPASDRRWETLSACALHFPGSWLVDDDDVELSVVGRGGMTSTGSSVSGGGGEQTVVLLGKCPSACCEVGWLPGLGLAATTGLRCFSARRNTVISYHHTTRFPHISRQRIPGLFQDRQNVFSRTFSEPTNSSATPGRKAHGTRNTLKFISSLYFSKQVLNVAYFEPRINSLTIQDFHFPGLFRTLSFKFQHFPRSNLFSRTFQSLENQWGKKSGTFQEALEPWYYLPSDTGKRLNPSHAGLYLIYLPQSDGRLSWPWWLVIYWDGLSVHRQSPIQVLKKHLKPICSMYHIICNCICFSWPCLCIDIVMFVTCPWSFAYGRTNLSFVIIIIIIIIIII